MVLTVAAKEYRTLIRDGRITWTVAIVVLMLLVSLVSAVQRYRDISAERATAQAVVNAQFVEQGEKNPHAAAHYGIYAFKPVTPLSFFDTGVSSYQGVSVWLEAHKQNRDEGRPADDMTVLARFGELTVAYTLQILLPLLVILLAFPAFAGERDQGTLPQVMSTGVTSVHLLLGKALGALAAIGTALGPVYLLGVIALLFAPGDPGFLPHALLLGVVYAVYATVFLFLTLAVSAAMPAAKPVLVSMIGLWAVTTFVVPRLAADVSRMTYPTPTAVSLKKAIDNDLQIGLDGRSPDSVIAERREQTLSLYGAETLEDLPINFQGMVFSIQEKLGNGVFDLHYGDLQKTLFSQQGVHELFGIFSPLQSVKLISMELSGTSLHHQQSFTRHAEDYRRDFIEKMNQAITFQSKPGQADYRAGPELWAQVEAYRFNPPGFVASLATLGPSLMTLLLWLAGAVTAAILTGRRLKVRAG